MSHNVYIYSSASKKIADKLLKKVERVVYKHFLIYS